MRKAIAAALVAAAALAACSEPGASEDAAPAAEGVPRPDQELFPVIASSEIVVGDNRFLVGLLDDNDAPVTSPKTKLRVAFVGPGDDGPSTTTTMAFLWTIKPVQGLWAGNATFDRSGAWEARMEVTGGGYDETVTTTFDVGKRGTTPAVGERPPAVDTPTIHDVANLAEITTDSDPDKRFYEFSIADALRAGRPAVIVFATPRFCTSQVCGPTLSTVKETAKKFPNINFVHVEPYDLDKVPEELKPVAAATRWGLPSEPWIFVTDASGRVAAKYEGSVGPTELRTRLRRM